MKNNINLKEENKISKKVIDFYKAYYNSERVQMFSYLDTSFQRNVPLNYFLIHSDYYIDLGVLIGINKVRIEKERKIAFVECEVDFQRGKKEIVIVLNYDYGGWKIDGKSLFKR